MAKWYLFLIFAWIENFALDFIFINKKTEVLEELYPPFRNSHRSIKNLKMILGFSQKLLFDPEFDAWCSLVIKVWSNNATRVHKIETTWSDVSKKYLKFSKKRLKLELINIIHSISLYCNPSMSSSTISFPNGFDYPLFMVRSN